MPEPAAGSSPGTDARPAHAAHEGGAAPLRYHTAEQRARSRHHLRSRILLMSALSYACVDGMLLAGFAAAGTVSWWLPAAYVFAGCGSCAAFYAYFRLRGDRLRGDRYATVPQLVVATAIQLGGILVVPQLAFFFLTALFVVFGIASLRLSGRHAAVAWLLVLLAVFAALAPARQVAWLPQRTEAERMLVLLCFGATLGRSILLGTFGRGLRDELRNRHVDLQRAVATLQERDAELERHRATLEAEVYARTAEMRVAVEAAEKASSVKSQFLAVMSHELRTPLNAVLGMTDLLQRTPLTERQRTLLGHVSGAGRSLLGIIEDILDLSRIEAGRTQIVVAPFCLRAEMHEILALFEQAAAGQRLSLDLDVDPALPEFVAGDIGRIRQILINLLGNALKFTAHGGVRLRVTGDEGRVCWAVADTGCGIDPAFLPHIYEAFSQEDSSTTRRFGGTGLGLAIVKRLVEAMGGTITIESQIGAGSTFVVSLPLAAAAAPAAVGADREAPVSVAALAVIAATPRSVLIVEDNATNQAYARLLLEEHGFAVTTADDGHQALELLVEHEYSVVLMDRQMPGLDGLATTLRIRGLEQATGRARTPVIAVSAHVTELSRRECLESGADDFLGKPYAPSQLLEAIARWCRADPGTAPAAAVAADGPGRVATMG